MNKLSLAPMRFSIALTALLILPTALPAQTQRIPLPTTFLGVSYNFYTLTDKRFEEVFGNREGTQVGFHACQVFLPGRTLRPALAVEYGRLAKAGESTISGQKTEFTLSGPGLSALLVLDASPLSPYLGTGLVHYQYGEKSPLHDTRGSALGWTIQAGTFLKVPGVRALSFRLFARWAKARTTENGIDVKLGGTILGIVAALGFNI